MSRPEEIAENPRHLIVQKLSILYNVYYVQNVHTYVNKYICI